MQYTYEERKAAYKKAISYYGHECQISKAIEEMSELTKELAKYQNGGSSWNELVDEIADVTIMMEQLRLIFGMGASVRNRMNYKVYRLLCRMNSEQAKENRRGDHAETERPV